MKFERERSSEVKLAYFAMGETSLPVGQLHYLDNFTWLEEQT